MSITETTYRPSTQKVLDKNNKTELARALISIFDIVGDLEEGAKESKDYAYAIGRIQAQLLTVL